VQRHIAGLRTDDLCVRSVRPRAASQRPSRQFWAALAVHPGLVAQGGDVSDLPCLCDSTFPEVSDHGLVDLEAPTCALDASEPRRQRPGDDDACHLHVALRDDFLYFVTKVGHGRERISPYLLLSFGARRGQAERRMDYSVGVEQLIKDVELACVARCEPTKHHSGLRAVGPSRSADPPEPMVAAEAISLMSVTRPWIPRGL
jgi:hypothetical protein